MVFACLPSRKTISPRKKVAFTLPVSFSCMNGVIGWRWYKGNLSLSTINSSRGSKMTKSASCVRAHAHTRPRSVTAFSLHIPIRLVIAPPTSNAREDVWAYHSRLYRPFPGREARQLRGATGPDVGHFLERKAPRCASSPRDRKVQLEGRDSGECILVEQMGRTKCGPSGDVRATICENLWKPSSSGPEGTRGRGITHHEIARRNRLFLRRSRRVVGRYHVDVSVEDPLPERLSIFRGAYRGLSDDGGWMGGGARRTMSAIPV